MSSILKQPVLKLNRLRLAVGTCDVETAFTDLCRGSVLALDIATMQAVGWEDWIKMSVPEGDTAIQTVRGPVRVPRVVMCVEYAGQVKRRLRLNNQGIRTRDHAICQITGEYAPDGNVDHLVPISRGGARKSWKNMAWMKRSLNAQKKDRTLQEMGWKLLKQPSEPKEVPVCMLIEPVYPEWKFFLPK